MFIPVNYCDFVQLCYLIDSNEVSQYEKEEEEEDREKKTIIVTNNKCLMAWAHSNNDIFPQFHLTCLCIVFYLYAIFFALTFFAV